MNLTRETLSPATEEEWLGWRKEDLTSTECAALFGCSPYASLYELYHRKKGNLADSFRDNDRMKWGRRLEAAIAEGVAEDLGLIVEPFKVHCRIVELRMGSSFDFKVVGIRDDWHGDDETYRDLFREHGPGIMEVKNVDGMVFRDAWIDEKTGLEAPPHIELQVQHQLETADMNWTVIAPLIAGNRPRPDFRMRDQDVGRMIRERVADFWSRYDSDNEPDPDFAEDADAVAKVYLNSNGQEVDMSDNNRLVTLAAEHKEASEQEKAAKKRKDAIKAEALTVIGEYSKVKLADGFSISATTVADNPGRLVTPDMVGTRVGERSGYRMFRVNQKAQ